MEFFFFVNLAALPVANVYHNKLQSGDSVKSQLAEPPAVTLQQKNKNVNAFGKKQLASYSDDFT